MKMTQNNLFNQLLDSNGPVCMVIKARLKPVGDQDRFQPAGFPEIGHVIYDAPRQNCLKEKVCIVDSSASMANHLEAVCLAGPNDIELHADLQGLPYVVCVTDRNFSVQNGRIELDQKDPHDKPVTSTFTEGHRIASDYFLDGLFGKPNWDSKKNEWTGEFFRDRLRREFEITEVKQEEGKQKGKQKGKQDKIYFIHPENWWNIYRTIFKYDPNSLVHGVMFAKEQIKIQRFLTATHEAFGASRVGSSGVKFDRLGKTVSGQPIFAVDEETAKEIRATFILDLAFLRSMGRDGKGLNEKGLNDAQKKLLLGLALWKIEQLTGKPFRFRTNCFLKRFGDLEITLEGGASDQTALSENALFDFDIKSLIDACGFGDDPVTRVYYPANKLFKVGSEEEAEEGAESEEGGEE
jgi:CRISPR-associated protein Csb1